MTKMYDRTTIDITPSIRDEVRHIARKDQTYDDLFTDLIKLYNASVNAKNQKEDEAEASLHTCLLRLLRLLLCLHQVSQPPKSIPPSQTRRVEYQCPIIISHEVP
jgi:hypothetical protein